MIKVRNILVGLLVLLIGLSLFPVKTEAITPEQRQAIEEQLRKNITSLSCSLWNSSYHYSAYSEVDEGGYAILEIEDPKLGAYHLHLSATYRQNEMYYVAFSSNSEIVIQPGENHTTVTLTMSERLPLTIKLSEEYTGDETYFRVEIKDENGNISISYFRLSSDGWYLNGTIPIDATEIHLVLDGIEYDIELEDVINSIISDQPLLLSDCDWREVPTLTTQVEFATNYVMVPDEFPTIQQAINASESGTTIMVKGWYYEEEQITMKDGVNIIGNLSYPHNVTIYSSEKFTIKGEIGGQGSISGVTIENYYNGEKKWNNAALFFDLGFNLDLDHCIVKTTGTADCIVANDAKVELRNVTLVGTGDENGISLYNNSTQNVIKNILFYDLKRALQADNKPVEVTNSLFWTVQDLGDIYDSDTNIEGDPEFLPWGWSGYTPSAESAAIKTIIEQGDGNYPGALMPMNP